MTENKWLNFAGFLNNCMFELENRNCPFLKYQQLDQYQRLEHLIDMGEKEASNMINCCKQNQESCTKPDQKLILKSLELELIP